MTIAGICLVLTGIMEFVYAIGFNTYDNRLIVSCPDTIRVPMVVVTDSVSNDLN